MNKYTVSATQTSTDHHPEGEGRFIEHTPGGTGVVHQAELHQTKKGTSHYLAHGEAVEVSFRGDIEDKPQRGKRNEDGGVLLAPGWEASPPRQRPPLLFLYG